LPEIDHSCYAYGHLPESLPPPKLVQIPATPSAARILLDNDPSGLIHSCHSVYGVDSDMAMSRLSIVSETTTGTGTTMTTVMVFGVGRG
jgi:hypothetical protein